MASVGRPSKLDEEIKQKLLNAIRRGAHLETACDAVGVSYSIVKEWRQRGEGRHPTRKSTPEYAAFAADITRAIADSEMALLTTIRQAAELDATHARWIMERRFPERWANTQRIEHQVELRMTEELNGLFDSLEAALDPETYGKVLDAIAGVQNRTGSAESN